MINKIIIGYKQLDVLVSNYKEKELKNDYKKRNFFLSLGLFLIIFVKINEFELFYAFPSSFFLAIQGFYGFRANLKCINFIINCKFDCNPIFFVKFLGLMKPTLQTTSTIVTGILGPIVILDAAIDGVTDNKGILRTCGRLYRKEIEFEDLQNQNYFKKDKNR